MGHFRQKTASNTINLLRLPRQPRFPEHHVVDKRNALMKVIIGSKRARFLQQGILIIRTHAHTETHTHTHTHTHTPSLQNYRQESFKVTNIVHRLFTLAFE